MIENVPALAEKSRRETTNTNSWGVDLNYEDAFGTWHRAPDETIHAVLEAMGVAGR